MVRTSDVRGIWPAKRCVGASFGSNEWFFVFFRMREECHTHAHSHKQNVGMTWNDHASIVDLDGVKAAGGSRHGSFEIA